MSAWRRRRPVRAPSVALLLALAFAAAPAAAVPTTLYAHFAVPEETFGLNTQEVNPGFTLDVGDGPLAPTLTCVSPPVGGAPPPRDHHVLHGLVLGDAVAYAGGEA